MFKIEAIQRFVFEHMSNLKYLRLDLNVRPGDDELMSEMDVNLQPTEVTKNVEKLEYKGPQKKSSECKKVINLFPNIKDLRVESDDFNEFKVLMHINKTNPNIESLGFLSFHSSIGNSYSYYIYFSKLKKLSSFGIDDEEAFSSFISRHSRTLEIINIDDVSEMTEMTAKAIIKCENLKYIKLGSWIDNINEVLEMLHEISRRSKPLTLKFKYMGSSVETFNLPEDKIFWDNKLGIEPEEESKPATMSSSVIDFWKAIWNGINHFF
jgi:hypothetical protein